MRYFPPEVNDKSDEKQNNAVNVRFALAPIHKLIHQSTLTWDFSSI